MRRITTYKSDSSSRKLSLMIITSIIAIVAVCVGLYFLLPSRSNNNKVHTSINVDIQDDVLVDIDVQMYQHKNEITQEQGELYAEELVGKSEAEISSLEQFSSLINYSKSVSTNNDGVFKPITTSILDSNLYFNDVFSYFIVVNVNNLSNSAIRLSCLDTSTIYIADSWHYETNSVSIASGEKNSIVFAFGTYADRVVGGGRLNYNIEIKNLSPALASILSNDDYNSVSKNIYYNDNKLSTTYTSISNEKITENFYGHVINLSLKENLLNTVLKITIEANNQGQIFNSIDLATGYYPDVNNFQIWALGSVCILSHADNTSFISESITIVPNSYDFACFIQSSEQEVNLTITMEYLTLSCEEISYSELSDGYDIEKISSLNFTTYPLNGVSYAFVNYKINDITENEILLINVKSRSQYSSSWSAARGFISVGDFESSKVFYMGETALAKQVSKNVFASSNDLMNYVMTDTVEGSIKNKYGFYTSYYVSLQKGANPIIGFALENIDKIEIADFQFTFTLVKNNDEKYREDISYNNIDIVNGYSFDINEGGLVNFVINDVTEDSIVTINFDIPQTTGYLVLENRNIFDFVDYTNFLGLLSLHSDAMQMYEKQFNVVAGETVDESLTFYVQKGQTYQFVLADIRGFDQLGANIINNGTITVVKSPITKVSFAEDILSASDPYTMTFSKCAYTYDGDNVDARNKIVGLEINNVTEEGTLTLTVSNLHVVSYLAYGFVDYNSSDVMFDTDMLDGNNECVATIHLEKGLNVYLTIAFAATSSIKDSTCSIPITINFKPSSTINCNYLLNDDYTIQVSTASRNILPGSVYGETYFLDFTNVPENVDLDITIDLLQWKEWYTYSSSMCLAFTGYHVGIYEGFILTQMYMDDYAYAPKLVNFADITATDNLTIRVENLSKNDTVTIILLSSFPTIDSTVMDFGENGAFLPKTISFTMSLVK